MYSRRKIWILNLIAGRHGIRSSETGRHAQRPDIRHVKRHFRRNQQLHHNGEICFVGGRERNVLCATLQHDRGSGLHLEAPTKGRRQVIRFLPSSGKVETSGSKISQTC